MGVTEFKNADTAETVSSKRLSYSRAFGYFVQALALLDPAVTVERLSLLRNAGSTRFLGKYFVTSLFRYYQVLPPSNNFVYAAMRVSILRLLLGVKFLASSAMVILRCFPVHFPQLSFQEHRTYLTRCVSPISRICVISYGPPK